jgi:PAS domain S-box-containing protein
VKRFVRNLPIKQKLMVLTMAISGVALVLACAAFALNEQSAFRRSMARDFGILADMFDDNVTAGLAFNDTASIEKTLVTLGANRRIVAACVYDKEGTVVATYQRAGSVARGEFTFPIARPTGQLWSAERLDTFQNITLAGEVIGVVYIGTDLSELTERAWRYTGFVGILLGGCLLVAFVLVSWLQRIVSQPIVDLAQTVATVASQKNYGLRALKSSDDELGRLIDGFNEMLAQIQARDSALQAAHDSLEQRVVERTQELEREQARFKFIFDAVPVGIAWMIGGKIASRIVNHAHAAITGVPVARCQELKLYSDVTPAEDRAIQSALHADLTAGLIDRYEIEKRYLHAGGSTRWAALTVRHYRGGATGETQEISTIVDITERKLAEARLADTHRQLLDTSRRAGMAEIATGVLHNVGNVLNSVNVSATLVTNHIRETKAANVGKLAGLFEQHKADLGEFLLHDPRGQLIPGYLGTLAESLAAEQQTTLAELDHLRKNIEHIKEIVSMQQSYARISGVTETVSLPGLIEEALRMNAGSLARHEVELVRDYQVRPVVATDKHKVIQILINLVRNAKHACDDSGRPGKCIVVRTTADETTVRIAVSDNGIGIPPENLTRIFAHGFTTRKHGHGFGLHSGALAAKELGGAIVVQSEGLGCGATFTLEIPLKR